MRGMGHACGDAHMRAQTHIMQEHIMQMPTCLVTGVYDAVAAMAAFETQGMVPAFAASDAFAERIAEDADRWAAVVRQGRITAE